MFAGETLLITGGTGSFGTSVLRSLADSSINEIRIFSRDEKKQDDLRKRFPNSNVRFYLGDVRDSSSLNEAVNGSTLIFHAAALKQVPSCEFFPMEAVKTNIFGTENVINAAIRFGVKRMVCLSTDKAVYPINSMGMTKALMERVLVSHSRKLADSGLTLCVTRYGNVMASRGSVIPLFVKQMLVGEPVTITNPSMTRFMMSLDEAQSLVQHALQFGSSGDLFVQRAPATTIACLVEALSEILGFADYPTRLIGPRHGEKQHETLLSEEEASVAEEIGQYYRIPADSRDLDYSRYFEVGSLTRPAKPSFTSANTRQLTSAEMAQKLLDLPLVQRAVQTRTWFDSDYLP